MPVIPTGLNVHILVTSADDEPNNDMNEGEGAAGTSSLSDEQTVLDCGFHAKTNMCKHCDTTPSVGEDVIKETTSPTSTTKAPADDVPSP